MARFSLRMFARRMPTSLPVWTPDPPAWLMDRMPGSRLRYEPEELAEQIELPDLTGGPRIRVSLQDRWAIAGVTRSGKTFFGKRLLGALRDIYDDVPQYVIDSKARGDFADIPGARFINDAKPPHAIREGTLVWQPPFDDAKMYGAFFDRLLKERQPGIVFVDELSSLGGNSGLSFPVEYPRVLKQGAGLGLCTITLTQDIAYIPRQVLGQTTHFVRFRLLNEPDAKRADTLLGMTERREPRAKYGFRYARLDGQNEGAVEYDSAEEFF